MSSTVTDAAVVVTDIFVARPEGVAASRRRRPDSGYRRVGI
jgi:hypothetical protein